MKKSTKKYTKRYGKRIPRPVTGITKKYHGVKYFTETIQDLIPIVSPVAPAEGQYNLALSFSQLSNAANYANLFEQFAIIGIKFIYRPNYNQQATTVQGIPRMFYTQDKSSTGVQPISTLQQDDNCKVLMSTRSWSTYVRMPQPVLTQGDGHTGTLLVQQSNKDLYWLRTADEAARGVLYLSGLFDIAGNATAPLTTGTISARVYLAFREQS